MPESGSDLINTTLARGYFALTFIDRIQKNCLKEDLTIRTFLIRDFKRAGIGRSLLISIFADLCIRSQNPSTLRNNTGLNVDHGQPSYFFNRCKGVARWELHWVALSPLAQA